MALDAEQFEERGWTLIEGFLGSPDAARLKDELGFLLQNPQLFPECMYYLERDSADNKRVTRIEKIWEYLPILHETAIARTLASYAEKLLGCPACLFKDKLNIRFANGAGYAPHQDSAAGWDKFANRFVSFGFFLGASNPYFGGFEIVSSIHKNGRLPNEKGKMTDEDFEKLVPIQLDAKLGDVLVLDSEAPHRTLKNRSEEDILHLLFTFGPSTAEGAREKYYQEKRESFGRNRDKNLYEFRVFSFQ